MADFKTHITTSTVLGVAYGTGAAVYFDVPLDQCLLATGMCSVSGMLPDIDSNSGVPLRESLAFGAAVVPMLLIDRFRNLGLSTDMMVLVGALIYLFIRFAFGYFLRHYTVHRGMFHSIPAAVIFAELTYLICDCDDEAMRIFKAVAVFLGYMSHLVLDEFWSLYWYRGRLCKKKSFGTALKLWGPKMWGNISTFSKLALLTYLVVYDGDFLGHLHDHDAHRIADQRSTNAPQANTGQPTHPSHGDPAAAQRTWSLPPEAQTPTPVVYDLNSPSYGQQLPPPPSSSTPQAGYPSQQQQAWPQGNYNQGYQNAPQDGGYQGSGYQNGAYPQNTQQYNAYPGNAYPSGSYQNGSYQNGAYQSNYPSGGNYPAGGYPQNNYQGGSYPSNQFQYGNQGGYQNGGVYQPNTGYPPSGNYPQSSYQNYPANQYPSAAYPASTNWHGRY
jgi:hypothetical protein